MQNISETERDYCCHMISLRGGGGYTQAIHGGQLDSPRYGSRPRNDTNKAAMIVT